MLGDLIDTKPAFAQILRSASHTAKRQILTEGILRTLPKQPMQVGGTDANLLRNQLDGQILITPFLHQTYRLCEVLVLDLSHTKMGKESTLITALCSGEFFHAPACINCCGSLADGIHQLIVADGL